MILRYNKNFEKKASKKFSFEDVTFCDAANYIIQENIVVYDDCYYFERSAINGYSDLFVDRTGNENHYNKLLIDDLTDKKLSPNERFW